ncbi:hypothetical protein OTU49_006761 [Cherax quadricarinatus]|uniref:Uncharacterized protein n=1 Tax=Cherax quadricarinatus TaxID=27406 RepID=A0AAW0WLT7_CHEQU
MPTFLLLLLGLTAGCVRTQDSSEGIPAAVASPLKKGTGGLGDLCEDQCGPGTHTTCDNKTCKCDRYHPVVIDNRYCVKPVLLGKPCIHHDQCQYHEEHALCREYSINYTECQCRDNYEVRVIQGLAIPKLCVPDLDSLKPDVPTLLGLGLGMSVLSALICLVLKIFARARFVRPRRYADAHINPPLTVSGGSRRPSQASVASSSGDLREGRVHHYLYMRAPNYSLNSETNTTTTGTSDSSPRTPKSTEQLLAVYHSVPEGAPGSPRKPQPSTSHIKDGP